MDKATQNALQSHEKRLRAVELTFTLLVTRLQELIPEKDHPAIDKMMEGFLTTIVKHGSPIMAMLESLEMVVEKAEGEANVKH